MTDLSVFDKQKILNNVPKIVQALTEFLPTINPLLADTIELPELHSWVESIVAIILGETVNQEEASELGQQLEIVDSFQPSDLLKMQNVLHHTLLQNLPNELQLEIYPAILSTFSALVGGFYIGKARRAAAIDMSVATKMGHDLKTPINAITGFSQVILKEIDGPITQFQKDDLTSIYEAGKKLLAMINDLSAAMKQDASRFGIYPSNFKVADLVAEVVTNIHPICAASGHTFITKLTRDLGTIEGDVSKIRWILLSLLLYLSRQGKEWQLSLSADRRIINDKTVVAFRIDGGAADTAIRSDINVKLVSSTEMLNLDVNLATCWRFCTSIGASLEMFEGQFTAFQIQIPVQMTSGHL